MKIFFNKNISVYAIFKDQCFNDTLTNDIFSFEQMGPGFDGLDGSLYCFTVLDILSDSWL